MNDIQWKKKYLAKKTAQYSHFDRRVSLDKCWDYITSKEKVQTHGFYPFIHLTIESRRVRKGKRLDPKIRSIYYAAHLDSWIYRYYSHLINEEFNERVKSDNIDNIAVAYRTDLGKNNIHFAKEAFNFIRSAAPCYIMLGDFTDFFDNLNHDYLKKRLCDLINVERLSADVYAVFKNITRFSYLKLEDLLAINGLSNTRKGRKEINSKLRDRVVATQEFHTIKKQSLQINTSNKGIPQGSSISAVLANVYMLEVDKRIRDYISQHQGFYMRYSDDFIIVIPQSSGDFAKHYERITNILKSAPDLTLKNEKTKIMFLEGNKIHCCSSNYFSGATDSFNAVDFLGFTFDGSTVKIRDKTISKYFNKMYRKAKTIINGNGYTPNNKRISAKNLYLKYSIRGSKHYRENKDRESRYPTEKDYQGNFFDYVHRAKKEFPDDPVNQVEESHMAKIRKRLNKVVYNERTNLSDSESTKKKDD